jgi:nicotinate-nucleotide pyrophosphorylase (carboxylating)
MPVFFCPYFSISFIEFMSHSFYLQRFIATALAEDIGEGDHTTLATIPANAHGKARLLVKQPGVIAGVQAASDIIHAFNPSLRTEIVIHDGATVMPGDEVFYLHGDSRSITTIERLILNIMQRMSGIATKTRRIQSMIDHTRCKLLDTRKTTPGFRHFEKWAVKIGGGVNHRYGLFDMILVKDNHVDFCGGMTAALRHIDEYLSLHCLDIPVEIEARNLEDVSIILQWNKALRILLDNFTPEELREAVSLINGKCQSEASGGIDEKNVVQFAETGVDFISMGALTHQISSLDLSLKAVL